MEHTEGTAVAGSCTSRAEAELQRHVLEAEGIPASIASDDAGGLHPELAFSRCATVRILVPASRLDEARELLASFEEPHPVSSATGPGDIPGDRSQDARTGLGRTATFWTAAIIAAVLLAAVISDLMNVFTGS